MRWEYAVFILDVPAMFTAGGKVDGAALHKGLQAYGAQGWELVSCMDTNRHDGATRSIVCIFKRPVQGEISAEEVRTEP